MRGEIVTFQLATVLALRQHRTDDVPQPVGFDVLRLSIE
jgi:hypothetical protein